MELEVVLAEGEDQIGGEREASELMGRLGVTSGDLVSGAYIDLIEEKGCGSESVFGPFEPPD